MKIHHFKVPASPLSCGYTRECMVNASWDRVSWRGIGSPLTSAHIITSNISFNRHQHDRATYQSTDDKIFYEYQLGVTALSGALTAVPSEKCVHVH